MTYLDDLINKFPEIKLENIFSIVCCGENLEDPFEGLCGIAVVPVFFDPTAVFEAYFGDFSEKLMQYENIPEYQIRRDLSKLNVLSALDGKFFGQNPIFVSANADKWAGQILEKSAELGIWTQPVNVIDLRKLYSAFSGELKAQHSSKPAYAYAHAKPLPMKFGLHRIAEKLSVTHPSLGNNVVHRAIITAKSAKKIFESDLP